MIGVWREAARRTLHRYAAFLPAIAINWVVVEVAGAQVPRVPAVAQAGLLLVGSVLYFAGAQRACDRTSESPILLALSRAGSCLDLLVAALGVSGFAAIGVALGARWSGEAGAIVGAVVAGTLALALVSRLWPIFVVPFLYEGSTRWSPAAQARIWSGPGIGTAWHMTANAAFFRDTVPVLAASVLLLGATAFTRLYWGTSFIVNLLFYAGVLPFLSVTLTLQSLRLQGSESATSPRRA